MTKFNFSDKNKRIDWKETKENLKTVEGGSPLSKFCPRCNNTYVVPTGKTYKGCRTYKCLRCKSVFGSPTEWGECEKFGMIGKDTVVHDCLKCEVPKKEGFNLFELAKEGKMCPYWKGKRKFEYFKEYNK